MDGDRHATDDQPRIWGGISARNPSERTSVIPPPGSGSHSLPSSHRAVSNPGPTSSPGPLTTSTSTPCRARVSMRMRPAAEAAESSR